jgi:hypothetical protein
MGSVNVNLSSWTKQWQKYGSFTPLPHCVTIGNIRMEFDYTEGGC